MDNPYESPQSRDLGPEREESGKRPTSVTVLGILNIIFGTLGLLCSPFSLAIMYMPQPPNAPPNPVLDIMRSSQGYRTGLIVLVILGMILSALLLAAGIGLLRLRPWGRSCSIVYAVANIVQGIAGAIFNYIFLIGPMLAKVGPANNPAAAGAIGGAVGGMIGGLAGLIYPVLLLIFMYRPVVVRALRPVAADDAFGP